MYAVSCVASIWKNIEATTEISLTKIIRHSIRISNQQTCKALFKNFTQICDALQSCNTLSPHFWVFLGCKRIHNLETNVYYNELHLGQTNDSKEICFNNLHKR